MRGTSRTSTDGRRSTPVQGVEFLRHPSLTSRPEHLLDAEEMPLAPLLLPKVVVENHVRPLGGEDPDVVGVVVATVAVDVMHHLSREEGTAQLPLGHRSVLVVGETCTRVEPLLVVGELLQPPDYLVHS